MDNYVFPGLDRSREGDGLEARFNAFKIPESNFLVFEATVRTCRDGCQPAYCTGQTGRSEPSFGRRRRDVNGTETIEPSDDADDTELEATISSSTSAATSTTTSTTTQATTTERRTTKTRKDTEVVRSREEKPTRRIPSTTIRIPIDQIVKLKPVRTEMKPVEITKMTESRPVEIQGEIGEKEGPEEEEFVREMIKVKKEKKPSCDKKRFPPEHFTFSDFFFQVLDSRFDMSTDSTGEIVAAPSETVCLATGEYYGLVSAVVIILCTLLAFAALSGMIYKYASLN